MGSNPELCGCASVNQADYRGTINITKSGKECIRWGDENSYESPENFPDAGLEDNNYCRNPSPSFFYDRAWCITSADYYEDCDVPYCFPPASSCPSSFNTNTNTSSMSEELQALCAVVQCIADVNPNSNDYQALTREEVKSHCLCAFEVWDCKFGSKECEQDYNSEGQAKKNINECCVNKLIDLTTSEASCDCLIKPDCEAGDSSKCYDFAEHCCQENDQQCKCEYRTKACRLALESGSEEEDLATKLSSEEDSAMLEVKRYCGGPFGGGAVETCCGEDNHDVGGCTCDFWMPLCTDFSNKAVIDRITTCDEASAFCCSNSYCECDFLTYAVETLGFEGERDSAELACDRTSNIKPDREVELESLQNIYNGTEGEHWYNNTGWMTEQDQCDWYGITCDEEGYVIEINLSSNNMRGDFPADSLSNFYKLKRLDLGNNTLHGTMGAIYADYDYDYDKEELRNDTSLFFNLRDLVHVDLSQNNLSGEVDVLFAPALEYVNFSHNNFTSINSFKKFKRSYHTLTVCDVSHNFINASASELMTNVPLNIEQLTLSSNLIHGPLLTSSLEVLANLRRFDMSMNVLSGELPDFSNSYPNLQVLDLSEQISEGLVGNIPDSLVNLAFLSTLNLASNKLSGSIPPVLGNMGQLRVLNLSSNELSQSIPKELGKLGKL